MAPSVVWLPLALALLSCSHAEQLPEGFGKAVCQVSDEYLPESYLALAQRNCKHVDDAIKDQRLYELAYKGSCPRCVDERHMKAMSLCNISKAAEARGDSKDAAFYAANAWSILLDGTQCCTFTLPPHCYSTSPSASTAIIIVFVFLPFLLVLGTLVDSCFLERKRKRTKTEDSADNAIESTISGFSDGSAASDVGPKLATELFTNYWTERTVPGSQPLRKTPLRVLPGAEGFGRASSALFGSLFQTFDFQVDNVRNQYEHFLSLWRSHVASVADRQVEEDEPVDEAALLLEAIADIHSELLDGFVGWRRNFVGDYDDDDLEIPSMGGATWEGIGASLCGGDQRVDKLMAEISVYLLVWGEAGNLRFMPELVYFIADAALAAKKPSYGCLYGNLTPVGLVPQEVGENFRSSLFLAQIVRPIYKVVFDEHYSLIKINANQKEGKVLHDGFDAYLPRDVANYDDWNELFLDPKRAAKCVVFRGDESGSEDNEEKQPLFDIQPDERFAKLRYVDWNDSLQAKRTKTHREVHSLWGVFATIHRIIVLHVILFIFTVRVAMETQPYESDLSPLEYKTARVSELEEQAGVVNSEDVLLGETHARQFSTYLLMIPLLGLFVAFAQWHVTGIPIRDANKCRVFLGFAVWAIPVGLYFLLRWADKHDHDVTWFCVAYYAVCALAVIHLLFFPFRIGTRMKDLNAWRMTRAPCLTRVARYIFWICVFVVKCCFSVIVNREVALAIRRLKLSNLLQMHLKDMITATRSVTWAADTLEWALYWLTTFIFFCADTQLWFMVGCSILGTVIVIVQRRCQVSECIFEDPVAKMPRRLMQKLLPYASPPLTELGGTDTNKIPVEFIALWHRAVEYMRYEDKVSDEMKVALSFDATQVVPVVTWESLQKDLKLEVHDDPTVPHVFCRKGVTERFAQEYCCAPNYSGITNPDLEWRLLALSRGLALPMPRPYRVPYVPGITVLIPAYGEDIILDKKTLYDPNCEDVALIAWLADRYSDEFANFSSRMQADPTGVWPSAGYQWAGYSDSQWESICLWASMRMQTIYRTVAGMCLYYPALQALYQVQRDEESRLSSPDIWDPVDCFHCIVSMQIYVHYNKTQLQQTNKMFEKFPKCLQVAYIDHADEGSFSDVDNMHTKQTRRYWSCLINQECAENMVGDKPFKVPRLRVELPGFPILGDGKGDNQNHAIPFMRGAYSQCIDANQGAYFEQMLMLPTVLGEFRTKELGDGGGKRIIGLPEHITSDIGSIGDFAASAERSFGTLLQRTYAMLGGRMHYGHPDIMNKQYMIQQGGVSKATKTLNLSEDIFAGMDFTLRGEERQIHHCEYFYLAKGRDLGFNSVLGFFSKISSGAGEQVISRQMFRLGNLLGLPETLTFWYAHVGYYVTQYLVSMSLPIIFFLELLMITSNCDESYSELGLCYVKEMVGVKDSIIFSQVLSVWFSIFLLFFIFATNMPLFAEVWYEHSFRYALARFIKQQLTLSPLLFIFQAKIIGFYVTNELRYGGATYVATGRGLPTTRRQFIGKQKADDEWDFQGLYLDYAYIVHYDGVKLLGAALIVLFAGGEGINIPFLWISLVLTVLSWLFAPYIFNPYQFDSKPFWNDVKAWRAFFCLDAGKHWISWFEKTQIKAGQTNRRFLFFLLDATILLGFLFVAAWAAKLNAKIYTMAAVLNAHPLISIMPVFAFVPPVFCSFIYGCIHAGINSCLAKRRKGEASDTDEETALSGTESDAKSGGCQAVPLLPSGIIMVVLQCIEAFIPFKPLLTLEWYYTFLGGLILKYFLCEMVILGLENLIRSRLVAEHKKRCFFQALGQLVYGNRMFRDFVTSSTILLLQVPVVLFTAANQRCCPDIDCHQLLLFRDTGHTPRQQALVFNGRESNAASEDWVFVDSPTTASPPSKRAARSVEGLKPVPPQQAYMAPSPAPPPVYAYQKA